MLFGVHYKTNKSKTMKKKKSILYRVFIFSLISDPIVNSIYGAIYGQEEPIFLGMSFLQLFKGAMLLLLITLLVLGHMKNIILYIKKMRIIYPLVALSLSAVILSAFSAAFSDGLIWTFRIVYLTVIFISAFILSKENVINRNDLKAVAGFIIAFYFLTQVFAILKGSGGVYNLKYGSSGYVANASVLANSISGSIVCFFIDRNWSVADLSFIFISMVSLIFTMRRSELIACLFAIIGVIILRSFKNGKILSSALILIVLSLMILAILRGTHIGNEFTKRMADLNPNAGTASGRYIFQKITLNHILNRGVVYNIIGEGPGAIKDLLGREFGSSIGAHSDWLDVAMAYGLIGVMCLLWFIFEVFRLTMACFRAGVGIYVMLSISLIMVIMSIASGGIFGMAYAVTYAAMGQTNYIIMRNNIRGRNLVNNEAI